MGSKLVFYYHETELQTSEIITKNTRARLRKALCRLYNN